MCQQHQSGRVLSLDVHHSSIPDTARLAKVRVPGRMAGRVRVNVDMDERGRRHRRRSCERIRLRLITLASTREEFSRLSAWIT
jgi:hypothetical protein